MRGEWERITEAGSVGILKAIFMTTFKISEEHKRWAKGRQRRYGGKAEDYIELIRKQLGKCAFSNVRLIFDKREGTPVAGGKGCHPLYAALDHRSPGKFDDGLQIVCYALNDLKGHLPLNCFLELQETKSWKDLMKAWRHQADKNPMGRDSLRKLIRPNSECRPC